MWPFKVNPDSTEDEIKKARETWLQEMLDKSQCLSQLIKSNQSGWKEFSELITDYIDKAKKRKAITALDRANEADIYQLKLLDHEVFILSWVLKIPEQFIGKVENEIEKNKQED